MENDTETEDTAEKSSLVNEMISNTQINDTESEDDNIFVTKYKSSIRKKKFHLESDDEGITSAPEPSAVNVVQSDEESRDSVSKPKCGRKKRVIKVPNYDSSAEEDNRTSDSGEITVKSGRIENKRNKMVEKFKNRFINKKAFFIETVGTSSEPNNATNEYEDKIKKRLSLDHSNSFDEGELKSSSNLKKNMLKGSIPGRNRTYDKNNILNILDENSSGSHSPDNGENIQSTSCLQQEKLKDLCDGDSESDMSDKDSNDEHRSHPHIAVHKAKHDKPKEKRMSAKLAMENMQKIKSESNRMLREKEVSLPYHRPRQISLKDILNRRNTGLDGRSLPIKMNDEQLKQYAQQLEERQKEIIELCKSESEEGSDEDEEPAAKVPDVEKETESSTKTNNQLCLNDAEDDVQANMFIKKCEETIENCVEDGIETQVEFCGLMKNDKIKDFETQTERLDNVLEHVAVHGTNTSVDSQAMELTYSENTETFNKESEEFCDDFEKEKNLNLRTNNRSIETEELHQKMDPTNNEKLIESADPTEVTPCEGDEIDNNFSDDDVDMSQIEDIIDKMEEGSKGLPQATDLKSDNHVPKVNPKLSGTPGSIIDLDFGTTRPTLSRKLTGIDLLKEKFVYFSKLKTAEEKEREKEKVIKPGQQHLKLKQELEEQMAEQRSLEWAKRIEEDKIKQQEMKQMNGELSDCEDILEKDSFDKQDESASESYKGSEEELSDQEDVEEKPRETNPLVDDEAEEDDDDGNEHPYQGGIVRNNDENEGSEGDDEEDSSGDETVSEEDNKTEDKPKKLKESRILKAFEDSDDEETTSAKDKEAEINSKAKETAWDILDIEIKKTIERADTDDIFSTQQSQSDKAHDSEDLPLAQQDSLFTQFSQEEESEARTAVVEPPIIPITNTQQNSQITLGDIVGMCSGSFPSTQSEFVSPAVGAMAESVFQMVESCKEPDSQDIGEEMLAMCTGQFTEGIISQTSIVAASKTENSGYDGTQRNTISLPNGSNLNASLRDLLDIEPDADRGLHFFSSHIHDESTKNDENVEVVENIQAKGKLVIMSSDEEETVTVHPEGKRKLLKKRMHRDKKRKQLQISDDEDSNMMVEKDSLASSNENIDLLVEYDSEENEVEYDVADMPRTKKRRGTDFLDQEAELSSEDEWKGSGDEDEAGLDRLEREEGDDDHYNQKKLRNELGKIHMRQLLDQDKREVRLLQELLLEDGELVGGHRQRKFRWKDNDLESEKQGTVPDEHGDKQDEVESEEQWRKQRHEREVFLRQLMEQKTEESVLDVSFSRTSIIKANLEAKSMSSLLLEVKSANCSSADSITAEKKTSLKELPSPVKKPFLMQKQFRGSFLSRGQSSLDRLAALARPLSGEEERPGMVHSTNKRSFVFSAVSPPCPNAQLDEKTKMAKRKADAELSTPVLLKRFRVDDKREFSKKTLLDQIDT